MKIFLHLSSNIEEYEITVQAGCQQIVQRVTNRQICLSIDTCPPCLRLIARPLIGGYSTILYHWITPTCTNIVHLYLAFPANPITPPVGAINTFTLTDATYGMPIDGSLTFTEI